MICPHSPKNHHDQTLTVGKPVLLCPGFLSGIPVELKMLVDTTLKLTLLHHGSLKDPRLPIPLFGADRIAYRRLQGIYPGELEGNVQYWL